MGSGNVVVTGAAGFIGSTLVDRLLREGRNVVGIDSFEGFYPRAIKERNVSSARASPAYRLIELDTRDLDGVRRLLGDVRPEVVFDLAARAGVRDSLTNPWLYIDINVRGLQNVLTAASDVECAYVFASSSSVYGAASSLPFEEDDMRSRPESPYGATKVAGEALVMAHHALTGLPVRIARLFTVYGPRQRPDLAVHKFAVRMLRGETIPLYAHGRATRDYTFVEDIVDGLVALAACTAPVLTVNLGSHRPYSNLELVRALEQSLHVTAQLELLPPQPGDVPATYASVARALTTLGWSPATELTTGLERFREWLLTDGRIYLKDPPT